MSEQIIYCTEIIWLSELQVLIKQLWISNSSEYEISLVECGLFLEGISGLNKLEHYIQLINAFSLLEIRKIQLRRTSAIF